MFSNFNPRTHKECDTWSPAVEDATTGFQSTPHKECDLSLFDFVARRTYFNPRTHKECDLNHCNTLRRTCYFNPRTHKECDAFPIALPNCQEIFQSTHSQRVRQIIVFCSLFIEKFQSTHSQRVRLQYSNCSIIYPCISIHALTKSATISKKRYLWLDWISIHALTKSATAASIRDSIHYLNFNPRTHKECDSSINAPTLISSSISIHALTKSAT